MQNQSTGSPQSLQDLIPASLSNVNEAQVQKRRKRFKPEYARFKLKFYYIDGRESVHYSYDFYHQYTNGVKRRITDQQLGLGKLVKCIMKNVEADTFVSAVIWAKTCADTSTTVDNYNFEVVRFVRNQEGKFCQHLRFLDIGNTGGKVLDIDHLIKTKDQNKYAGRGEYGNKYEVRQ